MINENRPSGLIIASKRSGTNFTHDILSLGYTGAVNEPLGLHNDSTGGKRNPLDPWTYSGPEHVSIEYGHKELKGDPYGSLLTRQFLGWVNEGRKLIKETDFLYLGWLLASVPIKTVVIQRDPRASIASFKKSGLYDHWRYQEKMIQFAQTVNNTPLLHDLYADFIDPDNFATLPSHQQLAFYYAIATSEITRTTQDHDTFEVNYHDLVTESVPTFQTITEFLNAPWTEEIAQAIKARTSRTRHTGTHGTFRKGSDLIPFTHIISAEEDADIRAIYAEFGIDLSKEKIIFSNKDITFKAREAKRFNQVDKVNRLTIAEQIQSETVLIDGNTKPLFVAKTLTTNHNYAQFLFWLNHHGIPLVINGKPLFHNERPQGKIRVKDSDIMIDEQFIDHPVPFVNWLGAAMYCAWIGGRLPSLDEWRTKILLPDSLQNGNHTNIGQQYADTTAVTYFPPDERGIYDVFGNMSIWIQNQFDDESYTKQRAGLGWNHTRERGSSLTPRPYWLGTAGVGIRPVFDSVGGVSSNERYLTNLRKIISFLTEIHHTDEKRANQKLGEKISTFLYN